MTQSHKSLLCSIQPHKHNDPATASSFILRRGVNLVKWFSLIILWWYVPSGWTPCGGWRAWPGCSAGSSRCPRRGSWGQRREIAVRSRGWRMTGGCPRHLAPYWRRSSSGDMMEEEEELWRLEFDKQTRNDVFAVSIWVRVGWCPGHLTRKENFQLFLSKKNFQHRIRRWRN